MPEPPGPPLIAEIAVAGAKRAWTDAGFTVHGEVVRAGSVALCLAGAGAGRGLLGWSIAGIESTELDGLPTELVEAVPEPAPAPPHPNGVVRLDHVVAFSPDLARTVPALEAAGLDLRRVREGPTPAGAQRQAFFRLGEAILEVVEHPPGTAAAADRDAPSRFWGLAFAVEDLDAAGASMGPALGAPRPAVQQGRRIATVSRKAGLGVPVALITL